MSVFYINPYSILLSIFGVIFVSLYLYFKHSFSYWRKRGVKGPTPTFPIGNFHGVFTQKAHISEPVTKYHNEYKSEPYFGLYFTCLPILVVNDLDLIKDILIKEFEYFSSHGALENEHVDPLSVNLFQLSGERWKDMRTKLSPVFTSGKMKTMTGIMIDIQKRFVTYLEGQMTNDSIVDIKESLGLYTMDVIASCGFGIEIDSFNNPHSQFVTHGKGVVIPSTMRRRITAMLSLMAPSVLEMLNVGARAPSHTHFFEKLVRQTMSHRETNNVKRNDLLQQLIQLKNGQLKNDMGGLVKQSGRAFTTADLIAQSFVFVIAGFETSSSAASHALYWLARHPELQERTREEIRSTLERNGGEWSYEALNQLEYTTMVIEETLRLHPALYFLFRLCTKAYKIPNSNLTVEKGMRVYIPVKGVHMDPQVYPEPNVFNPERFSKEQKANRHNSSFIPFGDGPRICIGMRFAMMQIKLALTAVLDNYEVSVCEKTPIPILMDPGALVGVPKGCFLRFKKIN